MAASAATPSSSRPNIALHSPYRTTCDNCMRSKVRCSKDRPSCRRCLGQTVPCIYSPSRKSKKIIELPGALASLSDVAVETNAAAAILDDCISLSSVSSSANDPVPGRVLGSETDWPDALLSMNEMDTVENIGHSAEGWSTLGEPFSHDILDWATLNTLKWPGSVEPPTPDEPALLSSEPRADRFPALTASTEATGRALGTHPETSRDAVTTLTGNGASGASGTSGTSGISSRSSLGSGGSGGSGGNGGGGTTGTSVSSIGSGGGDGGEGSEGSERSCARITASILQALESPGAPLKPNAQVSHGPLLRSFDDVISTNKAAIKILSGITHCTCSDPNNHLVCVTAVLFTVLAWYEACLGASSMTDERGRAQTDRGDLGAWEGRSSDQEDGNRDAGQIRPKERLDLTVNQHSIWVHIPPIQVGSLQLGNESRRRVVARIVYEEIVCTAKQIQSLTERFRGLTFATLRVNGHQDLEAQLQSFLPAVLQSRIERISQLAERAFK